MKAFQQGQIWMVNFDPSFGHEYRKIRPALIIESDHYIETGNLLTVIPLSSQIKKTAKLDVLLKRDSQNRLMVDSLVKTHQISSFDKRRCIKLIGIIDESGMEKVKKNLKRFLGI